MINECGLDVGLRYEDDVPLIPTDTDSFFWDYHGPAKSKIEPSRGGGGDERERIFTIGFFRSCEIKTSASQSKSQVRDGLYGL